MWRCGLDVTGSGQGLVASCCGYGDEAAGGKYLVLPSCRPVFNL